MVIVIARFFDGVGKGRCSVVALQRWDWERQVPDRSTTTASAGGGGGMGILAMLCFCFAGDFRDTNGLAPAREGDVSSLMRDSRDGMRREMAGDVRSEWAGERRWLGLSGGGHGGERLVRSTAPRAWSTSRSANPNAGTPARRRRGGGGGRRAYAYHQVAAIGRLSRRSVSSRTQEGKRQVEWI